MFPRLPLVKVIHAVLAVILVAEPILLAVPPSMVQAAAKSSTPVADVQAAGDAPANNPASDIAPPTATVPLISHPELHLASPPAQSSWPPANPDFTVNSVADVVDAAPGNGACFTGSYVGDPAEPECTLRAAIQESNTLDNSQIVALPSGYYDLSLAGIDEELSANGDLDINDSLILVGQGAETTTIDANGIDRVIDIHSDSVKISGVTIIGGFSSSGGGGGIRAGSGGVDIALTDSRILSNIAYDGGGGIQIIGFDVSATIERSLITENHADGDEGGGGVNVSFGTLRIINSTISGNTSDTNGGGIYAQRHDEFSSDITLVNTTIANNVAASDGSGIYDDEVTGHANFTLRNTIVALNSGNNCESGAASMHIVSYGHNLDSDNTCGLTAAGDLPGVDPDLGPLQDNGGPTFTHALQSGSPAIDAADETICPSPDQRGEPRPSGWACDIGAYEFQSDPVVSAAQLAGVREADYQFDNHVAQAQMQVGSAINTHTGKVTFYETDLVVPTEAGNLVFARSYSSLITQTTPGVLSPGWTHQYETHLIITPGVNSPITLVTPGGSRLVFKDDNGDGTYAPPLGADGELVKTAGPNGDIYTYTPSSQSTNHVYDATGKLIEIRDGNGKDVISGKEAFGQDITLDYNEVGGNLSRVHNANSSRFLDFDYTAYPLGSTNYRLTRVTDQTYLQTGRSVEFEYEYDAESGNLNLSYVRDVNGRYWYYTYAVPGGDGNQPDIDPATAPEYVSHYLYARHQPTLSTLSDPTMQPAIARFLYDDDYVYSVDGQPYIRAFQQKNGLDKIVVSLDSSVSGVRVTHGEGSAAWIEKPSYSANGILTQLQLTDSDQGPSTYTAYSQGINFRLGNVIDANNHATSFNWDSPGRCLGGINLPDDGISTNDLSSLCDSAGHVVLTTNPDGTKTSLVFNTVDWINPQSHQSEPDNPYDNPELSKDLLLRRIDNYQDGQFDPGQPDQDLLTTYDYTTTADASQPPGLPKKITVPGGIITCYNYNDFGQVIEQRQNQNQNCEPAASELKMVTAYTYASDNTGRIETVTVQPDSLKAMTTLYLYHDNDNLPDEIIANYKAPLTPADYYRDEKYNFSTRIMRDLQGREVARVENYWDSNGDQTLSQAEISSGLPGKNHVTRTYYDDAGRVQYVVTNFVGDLSSSDLPTVDPNTPDRNLITAYFYDKANRLAATVVNYNLDDVPGGTSVSFNYDGEGAGDESLELSTSASEYNQVTLTRYDPAGRVSTTTTAVWPGRSDYDSNTYNITTAYEYDAVGNVRKTIRNYNPGVSGGSSVSLNLIPDAGSVPDTTIHVNPDQPQMNVITCTTYDGLNRPEVVTQACVPEQPPYHRPNASGSLYNNKIIYNVSMRYIYKDGRQIAVIRNYNEEGGTVSGDTIDLDLSSEHNFITRTYSDGLGRAEFVVDNFTGNVLSATPTFYTPTSAPDDRNLATGFFYDAKGYQIIAIHNYAPDGNAYPLSAAFNYIEQTYYNPLGQATHTVVNDTRAQIPQNPNKVVNNARGEATDSLISPIPGDWLNPNPAFIPTFDTNYPYQNVQTEYQYDDLGRQHIATQVRGIIDERAIQTDYDDLGRVDKTTFTPGDDLVTNYDYAALGTEVTVTDPESRVQKTIQDALGNTIQSIIDPGGDNQIITNAKYDAAGRAIETSDAADVKTTTSFDALSRPTNITVDSAGENLQTNIAYDLLGNQSQVTRAGDPNNVVTTHIYNNVGWLLYTFENGSGASSCGVATSDVNVCTKYEYDDAGNLVRTTLGNGSQTAYEFDPLGRMTKEIVDPDRPDDEYTGLKITTRYEYDAAGNLVKVIRAPDTGITERVIDYTYDALGHLTKIDYSDSTPDVTYTYDQFGNRKTMSDGGAWSFDFNALNQLKHVTGPNSTDITYHYDKTGNRTSLDSTGVSLNQIYQYNSAGQLDTITNPLTLLETDFVDYDYDPAGRLEKIKLPDGFATRYVYDTAGRLDKMYNGPLDDPTTNPISSFDYTVNKLGQRTDNIESLAAIPAGQASQISLSSGYAVHPGAGSKPFGPTDTGSGFAYAQGDADGSAISSEAASPLNPDSGYAYQNGGSNPMAWQPFAPFLQAADTETPEPGETPESTATPQPTDTPVATAAPDESATPTDTPTPTATDTPPSPDTETPTPTASPTGTATDTDTPTPTATDTETPTPSPTSTPTPDSYDALFDQLHMERDPAFAARSENQRMVGQQTTYRAAFDDAGIHFVGLGDDGEPVSSELAIHLAGLRRGDQSLWLDPVIDDTDDEEKTEPETTATPPTEGAESELTPASPTTRGPGGPAEEPILALTEEPTLTLTPEATPTVETTRLPEPEGWVSSDNLLLRQRAGGIYEAFGLYADHGQLAYLIQEEMLPGKDAGDLRLTLRLAANLEVTRTPDGFVLRGPDGNGVFIGMPKAVDAKGRSIDLKMVGYTPVLTIIVPASWLAEATYPVVIDPVIQTWEHNGIGQTDPAIAQDADNNRALVTFTDIKAGGETDVRYRLINTLTGDILAENALTSSGSESGAKVVFNKYAPTTGGEYLIVYLRGTTLYAQRVNATDGSLIGGESTQSVNVPGAWQMQVAIDDNPSSATGNKTLVVWSVWSNSTNSYDLQSVLIDELLNFGSVITVVATANEEMRAFATYDRTMGAAGRFIITWDRFAGGDPENHVILGKAMRVNGILESQFTVKANDGVFAFNTGLSYNYDADATAGSEGKTLAVYYTLDEYYNVDGLKGQRLQNTSDSVPSLNGSAVNLGAVTGSVWPYDGMPVPDLSSSRTGWAIVWYKVTQDAEQMPQSVQNQLSLLSGAGVPSSTFWNITPEYDYDQAQAVDAPVGIVRSDGGVVTVHTFSEGFYPNSQSTLVVTLNAGGLGPDPAQNYQWHYVYDGLGRVTRACSSNWNEANDTCGGASFRYNYDGAGNLTRFDRFNATTGGIETVLNTYNGANQIATTCIDANKNGSCGAGETITIYVYDVYGNLTGDGVNTYTYNAANQLTSVVNAQGATCYTYTGDGDRYSKLVGANCSNGVATLYTLDPAASLTMTLAETTNGVTTKYWQGMDTLAQNDGANTRLFAYDGLGSLRQLTDGATLTFNQTFDPYGNPYAKAGSATTTLGYTGETTDANGFVYLRARYYNPSMGRFMQFDPSRSGASLYGYGGGNPISLVDPTGLTETGGGGCYYSWSCEANDSAEEGFQQYYGVLENKTWEQNCQLNAGVDCTLAERAPKALAFGAVAFAAIGLAEACLVGCGAVAELAGHVGLRCLASTVCVRLAAAYGALDQFDDAATLAAATSGDSEAQDQVMAMQALLLIPDLPINFALSKIDEIAGAVKYVDDIQLIEKSAERPSRESRLFEFGSGDRQGRAEALMQEAAKVLDVNLGDYVDEVRYDPKRRGPAFTVDAQGTRIVMIDRRTFRKTRAGQLIAGAHELVHAHDFDIIRYSRYGGDVAEARKYFMGPNFDKGTIRGMRNYAYREIFTEFEAVFLVERFLGGLTPQQIPFSTKYMQYWRKQYENPWPIFY